LPARFVATAATVGLSVNSTGQPSLVRELDTRTVFGLKNRSGVEFAAAKRHGVEFTDAGAAG